MNESMSLLARGNPTVYVLVCKDYDGNDAVNSVHATRASAEAAITALKRRGFLGFLALDIEEHNLTP